MLLLDSIGELAALFERADVVFMGGTLAARGGHNILEPAYFGKPVIVGRHMENFAAIAAEFHKGGALDASRPPGNWPRLSSGLLDDPGRGGGARQSRGPIGARQARRGRPRIAEIGACTAKACSDPPHTLAARLSADAPLVVMGGRAPRECIAHLATPRS